MNHCLPISMGFKVLLNFVVTVKAFTTYSTLKVCFHWLDNCLNILIDFNILWRRGNHGVGYGDINFKRGARNLRG